MFSPILVKPALWAKRSYNDITFHVRSATIKGSVKSQDAGVLVFSVESLLIEFYSVQDLNVFYLNIHVGSRYYRL